MIIVKIPFYEGGDVSPEGADAVADQAEGFALNESGLTPRIFQGNISLKGQDVDGLCSSVADAVARQPFGDRLCLVGGDHSVTYAGFKAFAAKNSGAGIVVLSSFPGCEAGGDSAVHRSFVKRILREGIVSADRVVLFGLREWTGDEKQFIESSKVRSFSMRQIEMNSLSDVADGLTELLNSWQSIYLSVGIDVADPSCAPGVDDTSPGGLSARQLLYLVQRLRLMRNLKMIDVIGVDAGKDINCMTSRLAAKIIVELS
ncbi:MAG: arginase family protein [Nanoarchaeota archaeon]|nr:arginase family protein [Nanoarchaeota archaeon]